jgi:hypothetical protein
MERRIVFGCCFCGEPEADKGLALVNKETGEFEQQWWCHVDCLLERMVRIARESYSLNASDSDI